MEFEWKNELKQCFGIVDHEFASHPSDEKKARELRTKLKASDVTMEDVEDAVIVILHRRGCDRTHIDKQLKKAKKIFDGKI